MIFTLARPAEFQSHMTEAKGYAQPAKEMKARVFQRAITVTQQDQTELDCQGMALL